jgi:HEAT repeat protein
VQAIIPAALAEGATVWPALLTIARDTRTRDHQTRQDAAFWLSRFATGAQAGRPNDPFQREDEEDDSDGVKTHAVFVLSQLPDHSGVPTLLDIARSNRDLHIRSSALFWLGQSGDPRALALFESLLR